MSKFILCADAEGTDEVGQATSAGDASAKMAGEFSRAMENCKIKSIWEVDDSGKVIGGAFLAPYTRNVAGWVKAGKNRGPKAAGFRAAAGL